MSTLKLGLGALTVVVKFYIKIEKPLLQSKQDNFLLNNFFLIKNGSNKHKSITVIATKP